MTDEAHLDALIEDLEIEEREVSAQRHRLHERLASFPNEVASRQEQELSKRRRELHAQIDELKAERSRRRAEQLDG
jgi:hypothetical protein